MNDDIQKIETEKRLDKAAFHRIWNEDLVHRVPAIARMQPAAIAYEMAWHAFVAALKSTRNVR